MTVTKVLPADCQWKKPDSTGVWTTLWRLSGKKEKVKVDDNSSSHTGSEDHVFMMGNT